MSWIVVKKQTEGEMVRKARTIFCVPTDLSNETIDKDKLVLRNKKSKRILEINRTSLHKSHIFGQKHKVEQLIVLGTKYANIVMLMAWTITDTKRSLIDWDGVSPMKFGCEYKEIIIVQLILKFPKSGSKQNLNKSEMSERAGVKL